MYNYIALRVGAYPCNETITDLVADDLASLGFESFVPDETGVTAYVREDLYSREDVERELKEFPIPTKFSLSEELIEGEDWNKEWEQNYFQPINIDDKCLVRSTFHNVDTTPEIEILIDPKMAFGTGHHATTAGMIRLLLDEDLGGKRVIDMGTGTGILAILSKKRGAKEVTAIEIDPYALENAVENGTLNNADIEWICGDAFKLKNLKPADYFLANINLNVILGDLDRYSEKIKSGGRLLLSGFYQKDLPTILEKTSELGFKEKKINIENEWVAMLLARE